MNTLLILSMGRVAGVTAAETRERLLRAAADAFARNGYDGTRVADIAAAAGVSNGALYAHFGSKAELLVAALRTHGRQLLAELFAAEPDRSITELLLMIGRSLPERRDPCGNLVVEGLAAARRDEDVAGPMRDYVGERADWIADLIRVAQADGEIDADLSAAALAHFCLLLVIGSGLVTADLHPVSHEDWSALLGRIAAGLAPLGRTTAAEGSTDGSTTVRLQIDPERCQGHGRCYDLAPDLFGEDDEGYGQVLGDGVVPPEKEHEARRAVTNCPERAIELIEEKQS